jgi:hypothetical protein
MGRKILAVIVALIVATAIIMIVEMLNSYNIKPPTPEVMRDTEKLREYMASGSALAYGVVLFGYILASFVAGFIVTKISRQVSRGIAMPIVVGVLLTLLGITNHIMLPGQPVWFMAASLISFIPFSLIGHRFAR